MTKVREGIEAATKALSSDGAGDFAASIMTTDTRPKIAEAVLGSAIIDGLAKGAGMIAPEMQTRLALGVSDGPVEHWFLEEDDREKQEEWFDGIGHDGYCRRNVE